MIFFYIPGHGSRNINFPVCSEYKVYSSVRIYLFLTQRLPLLQEESVTFLMLLPFHWLQDDPIISKVMLCPSFLRGLGEGVGWGLEDNGPEVGFGW